MAKYLVIVESPAKCKTISKFLGKDYDLAASFGHVRDLPGKKLGVDIDNDFSPSYEVMKDKSKIIKELTSASKKSDLVYIATDPDREGEAIAWHIIEATKCPKDKIRRIVFNEITEPAIKDAIKSSREIDIDLVNAQQARRVLDRLIGYKLSPLLSKKIQRGLSAGRVQSVAVKIICDREKAILAFEPKEYWVIESLLKTDKHDEFTARLVAKGSLNNKYEVSDEKTASTVKQELEEASHSVDSIKKSRIRRNPALPFITSTLQQEASRKLNWSAKKTMMMAQQLYEGVSIDGESIGLITYMRTDSTRLSDTAISAAKSYIKSTFSDKYLGIPAKTKKKETKVQDAHEAIRPSSTDYPPKKIESEVSSDHFRLYKLIWDRFIASQMAAAEYDRTQVVVKSTHHNNSYFSRASGSILVFDGFTRVYMEGYDDSSKDDADNKTRLLPELSDNQSLNLGNVDTEQKFTQPPPRFSEATLVKELEELGIGRPSTYAPTLSTIQDRGYIEKDQKKLFPSELGFVTNDKLEEFFHSVLDLKFTATMENKLDDIQEGKCEWKSLVSEYYTPLGKMIETANKDMEKVSVGERHLGKDPKSGKDVIVKIGRYGPMAQIGLATDDDKPTFAGIDDDHDIKTITLEEALALFNFPKTLGQFEDNDVIVSRGRFGPYVKLDSQFVSIPKDMSIHDITLDLAIELIHEKRKKDKEKIIKIFDDQDPPIQLLNGPYGAYLKKGKTNYRLPKGTEAKELTLEQCLEIIKNPPKPKRRPKKKK
ncbi:type I DNA topoisomerase [Candidatus Marinamargulisbacteria bacterium SCGC AG-343-D04]|nr:type I DNA topoisomerase [Candidatus Marinamargulisbacteria bacterium SCGC AG-343-D04]